MFDAISAGRTKDDPASNGDGEESTKKTVKDVIYETASGLLKKVCVLRNAISGIFLILVVPARAASSLSPTSSAT